MMIPIYDLERIKARQADEDGRVRAGAEARARQITARLAPQTRELEALANQALRATKTATKIAALRSMMRLVHVAARDIAACGRGCSSCCHQAVLLNAEEAAYIGAEIATKPQKVAHFVKQGKTKAEADKHYGDPCPFLVDQQCSIYESRPLACRTLYNLDADALLCTVVPGDAPQVPYLDHRQFTEVIAFSFMKTAHRFADIRDFFPNGKGETGHEQAKQTP